jgi:glycerophosphoryl diester phosphodiesterase
MTNNCSISSFNVDNLDDLKQACAQLKKGQLSFFSLIMNNNTVLHLNHVQQKAAGSASAKDWWNEMTERLNDDQVCFVVCNVDYLCQTDQVNRGKTVLIHWAPDTAP